jgi:hypothetical protein
MQSIPEAPRPFPKPPSPGAFEPPRRKHLATRCRRSALIELPVQSLADDLSGEAPTLEASRSPLRVSSSLTPAHHGGGRHLLVSPQGAQGFLDERPGDAFGAELLCDQRRPAGPRPPCHQSSSKGEIVEVAKVAEPAQGLLDLFRGAATLLQLPAHLRRRVRPQGQQAQGDLQGLRASGRLGGRSSSSRPLPKRRRLLPPPRFAPQPRSGAARWPARPPSP